MVKKTEEKIQKDLIKLRMENDTKHHDMRMEELAFARESEKIHHLHEMERQRIKTAEIRKAFERKQASQYPRKQWFMTKASISKDRIAVDQSFS